MRVHELAEECISYIAVDGVIGSDIGCLRQHLNKLDPSIDASYFRSAVWNVLCTHPAIEITILHEPILLPGGTMEMGSAPLPEGYVPPANIDPLFDAAAVYKAGGRGREVAFKMAGEEFKSEKQAVQDKRVVTKQKELDRQQARRKAPKTESEDEEAEQPEEQEQSTQPKRARKKQKGPQGPPLVRVVVENDGWSGEGGKAAKRDYDALSERWGARLRVRCTEDEVYYRLTGSYYKNHRITKAVFTVLQIAAMAREKGISGVELAPILGESQKHIYRVMKTLVELGLCTKFRTVILMSATNILVFHKFLHLNTDYIALARRFDDIPERLDQDQAQQAIEDIDLDDQAVAQPEQKVNPNVDDLTLFNQWGFKFTSFTESELLAGHVVQQRVLEILGHPHLKNHLLRPLHLLSVIGWKGPNTSRYARVLNKHINRLIKSGEVERVLVGREETSCIRLTKYGGDTTTMNDAISAPQPATEENSEPSLEVIALSPPYTPPPGIAITQTFERLVNEVVYNSGTKGTTMRTLWRTMNCMYRKSFDYIVGHRANNARLPAHLWEWAMFCPMETIGREHRLRLFSLVWYHQFISFAGDAKTVERSIPPPEVDLSGQFGDLSQKRYYRSKEEYYDTLDHKMLEDGPTRLFDQKQQSKMVTLTVSTRQEKGLEGSEEEEESEGGTKKKKKKGAKEEEEAATEKRGRPRRYIYVVDELGTLQRRIIGQVFPHPEIPPVLVWHSEYDLMLVPPPTWLGGDKDNAKPPITPEMIAAGKPPEDYFHYPYHLGPIGNRQRTRATVAARKAKAAAEGGSEAGTPAMQAPPPPAQVLPEGSKRKRTARKTVENPEKDSEDEDEGEGSGGNQQGARKKCAMPRRSAARAGRPSAALVIDVDADDDSDFAPEPDAVDDVDVEMEESVESEASDFEMEPKKGRGGKKGKAPVQVYSGKKRGRPSKASLAALPAVPPPAQRPTIAVASSAQPAATPGASASAPSPSHPTVAVAGQKRPASPGLSPATHKAARVNRGTSKDRATPAAQSVQQQVPAAPFTPVVAAPAPPQVQQSSPSLQEVVTRPKPAKRKAKADIQQEGSRFDIASIRRSIEIHQCITDIGGICLSTKVLQEHRAWAIKWAGHPTHPNAPETNHQMDRNTISSVLEDLVKRGKLKAIKRTISVAGGRAQDVTIICLPDVDAGALDKFAHGLSRTIGHLTMPSKKDMPREAAATYTAIQNRDSKTFELKFSRRNKYIGPGYETDSELEDGPDVGEADNAQALISRPYSATRAAELAITQVCMQLYGLKTGRFARAQAAHRAFIRAFTEAVTHPEDRSATIISTSPRIFSSAYLFQEMRVSDWYACIAYRKYSDHIGVWLQEPGNRDKRVKDVPKAYWPPGGFEGAHPRAKWEVMITILVNLQLITPLDQAPRDQAQVVVGDLGFTKAQQGPWASHFIVHDYVPVFKFAVLEQVAPRIGFLPVKTSAEAARFWRKAMDAATNRLIDGSDLFPSVPESEPAPLGPSLIEIKLPKSELTILRKRSRWLHEIRLSPVQHQALEDAIDLENFVCKIPPEKLDQFAYEHALPLDITNYELRARIENARKLAEEQRIAREQHEAWAAEQHERMQAHIAERQEAAKEANRKAWTAKVAASALRMGVPFDDELLNFVSRKTVTEANQMAAAHQTIDFFVESWSKFKDLPEEDREECLRQAMREQKGKSIKVARRPLNKRPRQPNHGDDLRPRPKDNRVQVDGVRVSASGVARKRVRHKWTPEDDETILECEAIIRARSRGSNYFGRQATQRFYPEVGLQTLRTRLNKILEEPGQKGYLVALEKAWFKLWMERRHLPEFPDPDPTNCVDFDIEAHLVYLRQHIDREHLRTITAHTGPSEIDPSRPSVDLPTDLNELLQKYRWDYVQEKADTRSFEDIADSIAAEHLRLDVATGIVVSEEHSAARTLEWASTGRNEGMMRAALKLVTASPAATYDAACGLRLISRWPEDLHARGIEDLTRQGVIKKLGWTGKNAGRNYGFTQQWKQLANGPMPENFCADAEALQSKFEKVEKDGEEEMVWPLIGKTGELAGLMNMVSNDEVDFTITGDLFPTRKIIHHNTRKLNDWHYEFDLKVHRTVPSKAGTVVGPPDLHSCKPITPWTVPDSYTPPSQETLNKVVSAVSSAGSDGITKKRLQSTLRISTPRLVSAFAALASEQPPRVFWAGYDTAHLVSCELWESWAVKMRPKEKRLVEKAAKFTHPRRWTDVFGALNPVEWNKSVNSVLQLILARPGISQRRIMEKLDTVLDRMELVEVLECIEKKRYARREWTGPAGSIMPPTEALAMEEEGLVLWAPNSEQLWV
ncbi:hypothetical protein IAT38_007651 [Cryptococcus sp. DSM 104549]